MKQFFLSVKYFIFTHTIWSVGIAVLVIGGVLFFVSRGTSSAQTRYQVGTVTEGTIISTVTASGQVISDQELALKPKVSGKITRVAVTVGQKVAAGTLIAVIDPTEAQKAVRDAQVDVDNSKLALQKTQQSTSLSTTQQQNDVTTANQALQTQYQKSSSDITATFADLATDMVSLQSINFGTELADQGLQSNLDYYQDQAKVYNQEASQFRATAYNDYQSARTAYNGALAQFKSLPTSPDKATIENILEATNAVTKLVSAATKSTYTLIQLYTDALTQNKLTPKSQSSTHSSTLNSNQTKLVSHLSDLQNDISSLSNDKNLITEKQQSLSQTTDTGGNTVDIQTAKLNLAQRQNALLDAQNNLADYYIRAPFAGTISSIALQQYDQAGSGSAIATIVTPKQLATLSLNEVDAAKVSVGQKATLTFDAIPDLTLTGSVAEVDPVGTVTQGVVSYTVKIGLDAQNVQVKSGMTVTASIQTSVHSSVLTVPQSAVKTQNSQKYVLMFNPPIDTAITELSGSVGFTSKNIPTEVPVEVGLSDGTNIEITSGVTSGEQIVTKTISSSNSAVTATRSTQTGFGAGGRSGGAAGIRLP